MSKTEPKTSAALATAIKPDGPRQADASTRVLASACSGPSSAEAADINALQVDNASAESSSDPSESPEMQAVGWPCDSISDKAPRTHPQHEDTATHDDLREVPTRNTEPGDIINRPVRVQWDGGETWEGVTLEKWKKGGELQVLVSYMVSRHKTTRSRCIKSKS